MTLRPVAIVAIGVLMLAALGATSARVQAQTASAARVLIIPFENTKHEAPIFWLGEASAVLLEDDLSALGVPVITREERRQAFERLQVPAAATLTDATVIRIGQLVGASEIITGSFLRDGETLAVRVRGIALETGRISRDVTERGPMQEMFGTFERIAQPLAPSARFPVDGERRRPTPAVFESYVKGLLAETPATAVKYLSAALSAQPSFDRARLALWDVYAEQGDHAPALAAILPVAAQSPFARRARFLAGLSYLDLNRLDEAFNAFKMLVDSEPTASALNNLGVVALRRGSASQAGQPAVYFKGAAEGDPNEADYFFNLGYAYALARDPQAAIRWLREAVRRNPADGDAHFILGSELSATGAATEAARERELARRLSSTYEQWERRPALDGVPRGLERVKDGVDLPQVRRIDAALVTSEQSDQRDLARFYLDRGRREFEQANDHQAIEDLTRAIFLSPYEAEAHLLIGRIHLRNNRPQDAIDALKISIWSSESPQAHAALGEAYLQVRDPGAARVEAERALALDPASIDAPRLLERLRRQ